MAVTSQMTGTGDSWIPIAINISTKQLFQHHITSMELIIAIKYINMNDSINNVVIGKKTFCFTIETTFNSY